MLIHHFKAVGLLACKTDLDMESPRFWFWENRLKLLLMVRLLYSFLLSLLDPRC